MKQFTISNQLTAIGKRLAMVLTMLLIVGIGQAWGQYTKASSIAVGDVVVLVYESGKKELSSISSYGVGTSYNGTPAGLYELTVEAGSSNGTYSLKSGSNYLSWSSGNSLATITSKTSNSSWKITFSNGNATIVNAKDNARKLQWNASSPRFACYTSSQTAVQLYKKVISKTLSSISISGQTTNFTVGDTFTFGGTVTATYSDKSTEDVTSSATFTGYNMSAAGQQTVTVSYEGKSVTYKITVSEPAKHKVYFYNGTNLLNSGGTEFAEGAAVSYSGTTPTSCDGESITFVGWATNTWEGKVAKGNITTNFYDIIDGDELPEMGTSNVNYYAVFAKATTSNGESSTVSLFSENFSSITSGNSTSTSGSSSTWTKNDNFYSVSAAYQAGGAVKLGTGSAIGSIVTKQLTAAVGETLTISFKVKGWSSVEGNIQVSGNYSEFAQPAAITYKATMSGSFETKTVSVVLTKANPYIKIATTAKRAFIDDIEITKTTSGGEITTYSEYITTCSKEPTVFTITYEANGGTTIEKATDVTALPTPLPETTRDHYNFAGWYMDEEFNTPATAGAKLTQNTTLYAKWTPVPYTVKFDAGSGTYTSGDKQGNFETGFTLPTATPCPYASTNGWTFAGWKEDFKQTETTVRPALYTEKYYPTRNVTLHAVYAKTGTAQGAAGEFILSLQYEGTTYYVGQTFDNSKLSAETNQANAARFTIEDNYLHYEGGYISHVATNSSPNITKQTDKANAKAWTIAEDRNTITFTSTADNTRGLGFNYNNGSPRFAAYQLSNADYPHTFTKTSVSGGDVQVTTYNSKPSCEAPVDPNWVAATITHTAIKANCGSTTVLGSAGENGPATISFGGTDLQSSVTVTASDGFLVSTDKTAPEKYAKSIIIYPNSTGDNIGKITQNVHVIANAPAQSGDYTGTITLAGNDIPGGSQVINVTAAVTCTQYTITWSVSGDTEIIEPTTFYAGGNWELPENPTFECNGREFVGWTNTEILQPQNIAPNVLYKEQSDFPTIESNTTFYAVFAEGGTDDGTGTATVTDILNRDLTGVTSPNTYSDWSGKTATSSAVYAGNSCGGNSSIQLRSDANKDAAGIITTTSGGKATNITVVWHNQTADGRTLNVYGKKSAYSAVADLRNEDTRGTLLGTIIKGTSTSLTINDDYEYIGLCSQSGAMYLTSISIQWETDGEGDGNATTYTSYTTSCADVKAIRIVEPTTETFNEGDKFVFDGKVWAINSDDSETDVTNSPYVRYDVDMYKVGTQTVTVSYLGFTATYEITINAVEKWQITWNVSGATNTGLSPVTVAKGTEIGKLPTPKDIPSGCTGKSFIGWTESNVVNADGSDITYLQPSDIPTKHTTYYAVFATPSGDDNVGDIFYESFNTNKGTGGNDEIWNNITTSTAVSIDGWSFTKGYVANLCIRLGTGGVAGSATTPALGINGSATLTFNAGAWDGNDEKLNIILNIVGEGHIEPSTFTLTKGQFNTYTANITGANANTKVQFIAATTSDNRFFLDEVRVSEVNGNTTYTDYTTGCHDVTITYYGFTGGYTTNCGGSDLNVITQRVNSSHTIPYCTEITDPTTLGRTFLGTWKDQNGKERKPGDNFIVTENITFYAQWALNTSGNTTLPTDVEDLATTDIVVTGGTTLTLKAGTTTINSLTLKGGIQADGSYKMPIIYIPDNATLKRKSDIIYLDLVVNAKNYYPFAVPFRAKNGSAQADWDYVGYINSVLKEAATYRTHFVIKTYNGANRAENGENRDANWVIVNRDTYLEPGIGYMITAMTYAGKDTVTMRIPMRVSDDWFAGGEKTTINDVTRNAISVTAHTGEAAEEHQRHAGWNFVASPYLSQFAGNNVENNGAFINGEILIQPGFDYGGYDVPYVTIPAYDFSYYEQVKLSDVTLSPEYSFFVQIGKNGTMTFETAGRQQAPAHLAARAAEQPVKMGVDLILSDDNHSDQTGIIICDRYTDAYEIGHDLEKMFGSAYNLSVYTLMADNTPLAFQALAIQNSMQVIPVGYRTPAQGEYTFALNEATSDTELLNEQYEQLILVDYETGALTNMLNNEYTFYSDRTQSNNRFALYAVPRQNTTTDLPNAIGNEEVKKVIYNDHFYILRDGKVFNGAGQIVK